VLRVDNVTEVPCVIRELAMIKVAVDPSARADVMRLVDVFRARVVDVGPESLMIETTGTEDKNDKLVEVLRPYGILELVRTGRVAMGRGNARHSASDALQAEDDEEVGAGDDVGLLDVSV
jgi:acetolactate synthase-1/3 small subunit